MGELHFKTNKQKRLTYNFIHDRNIFQNGKIKIFLDVKMLKDYHHHPCTTRNINGNLSYRKKMIRDKYLIYLKKWALEIVMSKCKFLWKISDCFLKILTIAMHCEVYNI